MKFQILIAFLLSSIAINLLNAQQLNSEGHESMNKLIRSQIKNNQLDSAKINLDNLESILMVGENTSEVADYHYLNCHYWSKVPNSRDSVFYHIDKGIQIL